MHKLTKITPLIRREIYGKYKKKMQETKWKEKELFYLELGAYYRVHINTIRKIISRWKNWDFTVHKSTIIKNRAYRFREYARSEKRILRSLRRTSEIIRYEKTHAGEMVHIDLHKIKNIKGEDPKKKKYLAGVIDDATRLIYSEVLPNKKAKTVADFMGRAYKWFLKKGITIKRILSDNGREFTTNNQNKESIGNREHSFEKLLRKLNIIHKYTRVRRPQTNGKIERWWRIFNENFFFKYTFSSHKEFNMQFKDWLTFYNLKRPHGGIQYMTPMEKLEKLLQQGLVCL